MKFTEFDLNPELQKGIEAIGFEKATPIQEQAIPVIMQGKDLIASAQTGTGKTAAFLLPVVNSIMQRKHADSSVSALVIVPTRELAMQIDQQLEGLSYFTEVNSIAIYGGGNGQDFSREKRALEQGADIVIGTPGRLIAHLNMGYVKLEKLTHLILDEADRMLDMGFHDDIMRIISYLPKGTQNLLFSATMPDKIRNLAKKVLNEPEEISIALSKPAENISQAAFVLYEDQKLPLVKFLLTADRLKSVIIFCSTKSAATKLNKALQGSKLEVRDIHSDLEQEERKKVLRAFKNREINVLVATNVLSRGIDIEGIDLVVNYDVPRDGEDYIHRIGRTARADKSGLAITLVSESEQNDFAAIEILLGKPVKKGEVPKKFGETPEYKPTLGSRKNQRSGNPGKRKRRRRFVKE